MILDYFNNRTILADLSVNGLMAFDMAVPDNCLSQNALL